MILFVRRSRRDGPDPYVGLKTGLFVVGALTALAGMLFAWTWLIIAAMVVLVVAFAVRFLPERPRNGDDTAPD
ncbi:MAG TPA: hypothetical protein VJ957_05530 [Longimicrobiales bacterium]|nr:hypothetical protein [Longimicrobiales bacterium]